MFIIRSFCNQQFIVMASLSHRPNIQRDLMKPLWLKDELSKVHYGLMGVCAHIEGGLLITLSLLIPYHRYLIRQYEGVS
jgi:hypothetical protein